MTTLLPDQDTKAEDEKMKEPAKRWRNRWKALVACEYPNITTHPGLVYDSDLEWPSHDVAATQAAKEILEDINEFGSPSDEWLGAFEVKE
jgi:hypothetical protein